MPSYAYRCTECGHAFDQYQAFSEDALTECPECGGRLRKVFGSLGVSFKGSGFYRNDSRGSSGSGDSSGSESSSGSGGSSTSEGSSGSGSSSGKSDSKSSSSSPTT